MLRTYITFCKSYLNLDQEIDLDPYPDLANYLGSGSTTIDINLLNNCTLNGTETNLLPYSLATVLEMLSWNPAVYVILSLLQ